MTIYHSSQIAISLAAFVLSSTIPTVASAQTMTSNPVVQALPSSDVRDLKESLQVLARNPRDLNALLDAGYASLKVQDFEAAIGFFGRAEEVSPEHPRVKMGKAAVYLRSGRPIEALKLFSEAEAAGASAKDVHSDRGLAYDLVGDQLRAQAHYREALRETPQDAETLRRMALSQAIAGNQDAFSQTLRPLIDKRDYPAFRSQAFGLAILGEEQRAKAVTEAVMPIDLARRIVPYLGYMPRLTKAQQAAAANLGIFPRAADIGRDDPVIAQYTSGERAAAASTVFARSANNRLEPAGTPLGKPAETAAAAPKPVEAAPTSTPTRVARATTNDAPASNPRKSLVGPGFDLQRSTRTGTTQPSAPVRVNRPANVPVRVSRPASASANSSPTVPKPLPVNTAPVRQAVSTPVIQPKPDPSFADAFADMGSADARAVGKASDAVDIAKINIPREVEPKPKPKVAAKPSAPEHPQRYWVQLGTAAQSDGLSFDWRRLSRKEPDLLGGLKGYTAPFGDKHRLLAGPVSSKEKRDELIRALTEKGLGVLPYTSPKGTEVQLLK